MVSRTYPSQQSTAHANVLSIPNEESEVPLDDELLALAFISAKRILDCERKDTEPSLYLSAVGRWRRRGSKVVTVTRVDRMRYHARG